jgi:hypothetical protein
LTKESTKPKYPKYSEPETPPANTHTAETNKVPNITIQLGHPQEQSIPQALNYTGSTHEPSSTNQKYYPQIETLKFSKSTSNYNPKYPF